MFLSDIVKFSKRNEKENRYRAPRLAAAGGILLGGVGTAYATDRKLDKLYDVALDNVDDQAGKMGLPKRRIVSPKNKVQTLKSPNILTNTVDKISQLNKNAPRNIALGSLVGAGAGLAGYGAYRGGKALVNKLRNKDKNKKR